MLKRIKRYINIRKYKFKMRRIEKIYMALWNKEQRWMKKYLKASNDYYNAIKNLYPERNWEARADREFFNSEHN